MFNMFVSYQDCMANTVIYSRLQISIKFTKWQLAFTCFFSCRYCGKFIRALLSLNSHTLDSCRPEKKAKVTVFSVTFLCQSLTLSFTFLIQFIGFCGYSFMRNFVKILSQPVSGVGIWTLPGPLQHRDYFLFQLFCRSFTAVLEITGLRFDSRIL